MSDIRARCGRILREARERASLTQRELADLAGTSQSAIARLEQGTVNPTVQTLARCIEATGFGVRLELLPPTPTDQVVERYKKDVDRGLLKENLRKPMDERLRSLGDWLEAGEELERATRESRRRR